MDFKAARAAAFKAAETIVAKGAEMTDEDHVAVKGYMDEINKIDGQIAAAKKSSDFVNQLGALATSEEEAPADNAGVKARSLGEHAVKSMGAEAIRGLKGRTGTITSGAEFKAAGDAFAVGTTTVADLDRSPVGVQRTRLQIEDLLNVGTISGNAITYFVEQAVEGEPGMVAEGATKPKVTYAYEEVTERLGKAAGLTDVTEEALEDLDFIVSEFNGKLVRDLNVAVQKQLLNGNGTAPQLTGLLNREGIQTEASANVDDNDKAIYRAADKVFLATDMPADGVVMHPDDYREQRLKQDKNGQYIAGGVFTGAYGNGSSVEMYPAIWGLPTVVTPAIAKGTVLVGAFSDATLFTKGGVKTAISLENKDNFETNKGTLRAERRLALKVPRAHAFVKVTLSSAPAA
jgi:HK97 family phage major capsid protein